MDTPSTTRPEPPARQELQTPSPRPPTAAPLRPDLGTGFLLGTVSIVISKVVPTGVPGGEYLRVASVPLRDPAAWQTVQSKLTPGRYRVACHGPRGRFLGGIACAVLPDVQGLTRVRAKVQKDYRTPSANSRRLAALTLRVKDLERDRLAFAMMALRLDQEIARLGDVGSVHRVAIQAYEEAYGRQRKRPDAVDSRPRVRLSDSELVELRRVAPAVLPASSRPKPLEIELPDPPNHSCSRNHSWMLVGDHWRPWPDARDVPDGYRVLYFKNEELLVPRRKYRGYVTVVNKADGIRYYRSSKNP